MMKFKDFVEKNRFKKNLIILCGLPATGKTGVAEVIGKNWGHVVVRSDVIRVQVFKERDIFDEKFASNMKNRNLIYEVMFQTARSVIEQGMDVLLDATFIKNQQRLKAGEIASNYNLALFIMETKCPEDVCIKRISKRTRDEYESNAITREAYYNNKNAFEEVDIDSLKKSFPGLDIFHYVIDTSLDGIKNWNIIKVEHAGENYL